MCYVVFFAVAKRKRLNFRSEQVDVNALKCAVSLFIMLSNISATVSKCMLTVEEC